MAVETRTDNYPLCSGIHTGSSSSASLYNADKNFDVFTTVGVVCFNDTQTSHGLVTSVTKDTVTVDSVSWNTNDKFSIYCTAEKNSYISSYKVTKILGRKITTFYNDSNEESLPGDVFGPGQPESHK